MTESEYLEWLRNPANDGYRIQLFEIGHSAGTVDLATGIYKNIKPFGDFIIEEPDYTTSIDSVISIGSLRAMDVMGDGWNNYNFRGYETKRYFGDTRWEFSEFKLVGTMLNGELGYDGNGVFTFQFSNIGYKLSTPVQSSMTENGERKLLPLGICKLVKPQLVDAFNLTYRYSDDPANCTLDKLYDIGLELTPLSTHITVDSPSAGLFTFNSGYAPAGELRINTSSTNTTAQEIAQQVADLHGFGTIQTNNFGSAQSIDLGVEATGLNIDELFNLIAASISANYRIDENNDIEFTVPDLTTTVSITNADVVTNFSKSGEISAVNRVVVKWGYNQNPYSESDVSPDRTVLPLSDVETLTLANKSITEITMASTGSIDEEIVFDTIIVNETDAQTLATSKAVNYSSKRILWSGAISVINQALKVGDALDLIDETDISAVLVTKIHSKQYSNTANIEIRA